MSVNVSESITVNASPDDVLAIVRDIDTMSDWFPGCVASELLESDADGMPARAMQVNDVKVAKDKFELIYTNSDNSLAWTLAAPSTAQKVQNGSWTVVSDGSGSKVTFDLTIDAALPMPGFMQKKIVKDTVKNGLQALKKRAES